MNLIKRLFSRSTSDEEERASPVPYSGSGIFGSLGGSRRIPRPTQSDFIPNGFNGETIDVKGPNGEAVWLGLQTPQMQSLAYELCSPLAAVIDRIAQADTNGRIKFLDEDENVIKNVSKIPRLKRFRDLMLNPNPIQTRSEFNNEQGIIAKKYGYCPVFVIAPFGMDKTYAKALINLDPLWCTPVRNWDFDPHDEKNLHHIKEWNVQIMGKNYTIPNEDILLIKDGLGSKTNVDNFNLPMSKIEGLDYFISNIMAAMEADNVLLKKKGPLGVFSHDPKSDIAGWQPLDPKDKKDLQHELSRYGMSWGQLQYVISKTPIKWNPMSFNVRDLMTKETIRMGIDGICDRFDYPAELMSGKNATYENRSSAEKFLYQNNIIPYSLRKTELYCKYFNIEGYTLNFNHLPVLQEDILHAGQARESMSNSLLVDWQAGMISYNEYRELQELDPLEGKDDYYYADWVKEHAESLKLLAPAPKENSDTKPKKDEAPSKGTGTKK